jgi:alpha-L-fucosidase 2
VIAIHLTASQPGHISFDALLQTEHKQFSVSRIDDHTIALNLKVNDGVLKGSSYLSVSTKKGKVSVTAKGINVSNADEATLYLSAATSFVNYKNVSGQPNAICRQVTQAVKGKTYQAVKTAHVADYHHYFNTFSINLGGGADEALPTDERIRRFEKTFDASLLTLYTQYARYLMISCSRPDSKLPANLQGIWNDQITPSWGSKFTTNINLEMNYWPVDELNLSACAQPLINMVKGLSIAGRQTAKINYNLPGWVLHHNTDIWLGTAPINASNHGIWVSGGAWLCHNMWDHYLFTRDEKFLREQAYPAMKACAEFFNSFLIKDPKTGYLISTPSNSPEHGGLVAGPAMDHQIIRDLFKNCIAAAKVLHTDAAFSKTLQAKYNRIAPNQIGKYGQLQEWMQDIDDTTDTHRHVSHLWGVYPGTDITWDNSPALMHAAEQSFKYRGDDGTGWSLAWKVNLMARFKHADHAMELVKKLLSVAENGTAKERGGVYHNLFDAHPPFQIDGNFGGAAGIAEMLLQSQQGYIDLLPALPAALPEGEVKGICARGAFVLNIKWTAGRLQQVTVTSKAGGKCQLKYAGRQIEFNTTPGKTYTLNGGLKLL